jgi:multidrug efflux pump subunit AcrA (membrane-fusion protein)
VRIAEARLALWPRSLRVPSELAPFERVTLAAEVGGRIESVSVDVGTRVDEGAAVARLRTRELELGVAAAQAALAVARARLGSTWDDNGGHSFDPTSTVVVRQAQTELDEAEREHARLQPLAKDGVSTQVELDRAALRSARGAMDDALQEAAVLAALAVQRRAELDLARERLARAEITAPFAGVIAERLVGPGDFVAAGDGVVELASGSWCRATRHSRARSLVWPRRSTSATVRSWSRRTCPTRKASCARATSARPGSWWTRPSRC